MAQQFPRFKHIDESVQRQLDEVRFMSETNRPGDGDRWLHNVKSLQHHISNQLDRKKAERRERRQEEEKNEPLVDSDWAVALKASLAEAKTVNNTVGSTLAQSHPCAHWPFLFYSTARWSSG
jgi:hypothetical protein